MRYRRESNTALMLVVGLMGGACGDKSTPASILRPPSDDAPPAFLLMPSGEVHSPHAATISYRMNEAGEGLLHLLPADDAGCSEQDIQQVRHLKSDLRFLKAQTQVVELQSLAAGKTYVICFSVQDRAGNAALLDPRLRLSMPETSVRLPLAPIGLTAQQGVRFEFKPDLPRSVDALRLVAGPEWLTLDRKLRLVGGTPDYKTAGSSDESFTLEWSEEGGEYAQTYRIHVTGDPLARHAWHLENRGQTAFAHLAGTFGFDSSISAVHAQGITGRGVVVRLIDTGLQLGHPDLKDNVADDGHVNFELSANGGAGCQICDPKDPSPPVPPGAPGDHGTSMAGIIAAKGWNDFGSRGVAPNATLVGFNMFAPRIKFDESMLIEALADGAAVVNMSVSMLTPPLEQNQSIDLLYESMQASSVLTHREGRGPVYVKAAGDHFAKDLDANFDAYNSVPWTMVIGGMGAGGRKSHHSSAGANLWVSAPGGDRGFQSDFALAAEPKIKNDFLPGIIATDLHSVEHPCQVGYAKSMTAYLGLGDPQPPEVHALGNASGFNFGWNRLNSDCSHRADASGSEAAAAVVSGVAALLLEVNPQLSWRDVKHIIAKTAKPIDERKPVEFVTIKGHRYPKIYDWSTNGAGFRFHTWYGFGLLDAAAAVQYANPSTYKLLPDAIVTDWRQGGSTATIPAQNPTGISQTIPIMDNFTVEAVQVVVNITHENVSHLGIEVQSPAGTRSMLLPPKSGATHANFRNMVFLSNAFYHENSRGDWSLHVFDAKGGRASGKIENWSIRFLGHYN